MPAERLSMRTIREVLRLKWEKSLTNRQIATSCQIARSTVREYLERAARAGLAWAVCPELDDVTLERLLYPPAIVLQQRALPSMQEVHKELKRPGVTLKLLWLEHKANCPEGYQYTQFCVHYRQWKATLDLCLRQDYRAGEKLRGADDPGDRSGNGTDDPCLSLRGHPGGKQLHLLLGLREPEPARLD